MPRILEIRPAAGGNKLAYFDVELFDYLRIYNMVLRRSSSGLRVFAPTAYGRHAATFAPELAERITVAAKAALEGGVTADAEYR